MNHLRDEVLKGPLAVWREKWKPFDASLSWDEGEKGRLLLRISVGARLNGRICYEGKRFIASPALLGRNQVESLVFGMQKATAGALNTDDMVWLEYADRLGRATRLWHGAPGAGSQRTTEHASFNCSFSKANRLQVDICFTGRKMLY